MPGIPAPLPKIKPIKSPGRLPVQVFSPQDREFISRRLAELGNIKESMRFEACGNRLRILRCKKEGRQFAIRETCKSRICPECQRTVRNTYFRNWYRYVGRLNRKSGFRLMLLTLTFYTSGRVEDVHVKKSSKMVRRLLESIYGTSPDSAQGIKRRSAKQNGVGAIGVAEIGKRWNLHYHILVNGPYVPQAHIAQRWYEITGNSFIVDVRAVRHGKKRLRGGVWEVLKYLAKVPVYDGVVEYLNYLQVLKGCRRIHTYGSFYNAVHAERESGRLRCPFCESRMILDGLAWRWCGQSSYYWWHRRLKRHREGLEKIPDWVIDMAADLVGYPGCVDHTGRLPDEFVDGFFLHRPGIDYLGDDDLPVVVEDLVDNAENNCPNNVAPGLNLFGKIA